MSPFAGAAGPRDEPPSGPAGPPGPGGTDRRLVVLGALTGAAVVALTLVVVLRGGSGGDDATTSDRGGQVGAAIGEALGEVTTTPGNRSPATPSTAGTTASTGPARHDDLPAVTIPEHSSAPTTIPGSQPSSVPGAHGDQPIFGHLVVDLPKRGFLDFPVHLRRDQTIQVLSLGDDGIDTDIEVFGPDGASVGGWKGGKPGVINGLEWSARDPLPATGTYVVRVVHTGGSDKPFVIGFFGNK